VPPVGKERTDLRQIGEEIGQHLRADLPGSGGLYGELGVGSLDDRFAVNPPEDKEIGALELPAGGVEHEVGEVIEAHHMLDVDRRPVLPLLPGTSANPGMELLGAHLGPPVTDQPARAAPVGETHERAVHEGSDQIAAGEQRRGERKFVSWVQKTRFPVGFAVRLSIGG
jgi:hypothetical protein